MNKHVGRWSELTLEELKAFIGVDIVIKKFWGDRLEGIWNTNDEYFLVEIPGIKKVFPRTRFYQIARYLHFTNEEKSITIVTTRTLINFIKYDPSCTGSVDVFWRNTYQIKI